MDELLQSVDWQSQLEYLLRMVLSAVAGALIGIEREKRMKEAGIRTHLLVCLASCLMMLVSKYGFFDLVGREGIGLDPSRVAAGIVTGIGFLGAGIIFTRGHAINGLTTSAGVWATVGVGMALGGGMYIVGAASAVLILLVQAILHRDIPFLPSKSLRSVHITLTGDPDALPALFRFLEAQQIEPQNIQIQRRDRELDVRFYLHANTAPSLTDRLTPLLEAPFVKGVTW